MKKRYLYSLLFGIPGLFVAGTVAIVVFGAFTGLMWLFVFGDNRWPAYAETIISVLFGLVFLLLWIGLILLGYGIGKKLEQDLAVNRNHILVSAGLTLFFLLLVVLQQWSVGNIGPRSDSALCSDFCAQHGYSGSGMPPLDSGLRTCSCYDDSGNEVLTIPVDHLHPDFLK